MLPTWTTWHDVQHRYDWFAQMRAVQPVWLDEQSQCWHVFRSADVRRVLTEHATFSANPQLATSPEHDPQQVSNLATMDPPRHHQYRALVASAFSLQALTPLTEHITTLVQDQLALVRPPGSLDLIADLAAPVSATIIAEMLGLPSTDHPRFIRWADALLASQVSDEELFQAPGDQRTCPVPQRTDVALEEMTTYLTSLLMHRRLQPRDDLMRTLLTAEVDGKRLSQEEILSFCILLLLAGHATTMTLLGNAMLCLNASPAALRALQTHPGLLPRALEEVLRYASPVYRVLRVTRHPVEIAHVTIPAHARVFAWLASANRDGVHFTHPAHFDILRTPNRHLAFGAGSHVCLGASLARLEASIILSTLLTRCPGLCVVADQPLELVRSHLLFGVKQLLLTFPPSSSQEREMHTEENLD